MAIQIANAQVVRKIEWLAQTMHLGKTAVVERALDGLSATLHAGGHTAPERIAQHQRIVAVLAVLDGIPDRQDLADILVWDDHGLPR